MNCPIDGEVLVIADRSGVEIDYCPKCRGVWLDRGELDKIIERMSPAAGQNRRDHGRDNRRREPQERESIFSELFDFF